MDKIEIIGLIIIIIIIIIIWYKLTHAKNKDNEEHVEHKTKENLQNKKVIKYFGANYCPYSNKSSMSYKVMNDLKDKYNDDIEIIYYWTDAEGEEEGRKYNVQFVPTILNTNDEEIQLSLPEGTDTTNMNNEELKELLLNTVFAKV